MSILYIFIFICYGETTSAIDSASVKQTRDNNYSYPDNVRLNINTPMLAKCMNYYSRPSGFNKEFFAPRTGYPNNYKSKGYSNTCGYSRARFFSYLTVNENRACDYETGKEQELKKWILEQKDNSIDLLGIYQKSIQLNGNSGFDALLTIHQLLRNEARWWSKKFYSYETNNEATHKFWNKFIDIRGDLKESGGDNEGDHRGSWYRIWGMMLYRLSMNCKPQETECRRFESEYLEQTKNNYKSSFVALGAELCKYLFDGHGLDYKPGADRSGKARINSAGSQTAGYLLEAFSGKDFLTPDDTFCSRDKIHMRPCCSPKKTYSE